MKNEIWKDVPGYVGSYQVSNLGKIKSLSRFNGRYSCKEQILKPRSDKKGYLRISLYKNNKIKNFFVHRLVAMAFIPNPDNLPQINHKNEIKTDNRVENLEWCSAYYNMNFGKRPDLYSKPIKQIKGNIEIIYKSISEAERQTGVARSNIVFCAKGGMKTAGKSVWKFI